MTENRRDEHRFTTTLVFGLVRLLESHGYRRPDGVAGDLALGRTVGVLHELCETYEGRRDGFGKVVEVA
ncbi:hypothetical protein [Allonocardiopsis opalescens]|uniref:Uncharacterized protein n=1 Tax=Allonocardiopsis opalescens TaxID=1144618 RepID=A0A2T0Q7F2_9ACTN|nr:hypothetical protein [Allonocardiopsis opalescens]PRX99653.1 hypothetical protein CLV72_103258 [Allonocardiopsis opalescens]